MYDVCVSSDEVLLINEYKYKNFKIEIKKQYSSYYDVKYFVWNIFLNDGSTYGMYHGGFKTEKEALINAKETVNEKFMKV